MKRPSLKESIPAAIVLVFLGAAAALVIELLVAGVAGRAADPGATTALITLLGLCVPALVTLYLRDSEKPPPDDTEEYEAAQKTRDALREYLDKNRRLMVGWRPRWTL